MSAVGTIQQPPSPPYTSDDDFGFVSRNDMSFNTYTPPEPARLSSNESSNEVYEGLVTYHPIPQPAYGSQPVFVRHVNHRSTPIGTAPINNRDGRALGPTARSTSSGRPSQARKKKPLQREHENASTLSKPLSEITKDYAVPIKDMEAWVNRSVEERLREAGRKKGHIARPMNSFILYRSAYADRVKQYCKENNHQIVSKVTGQSWPLEPKEIRNLYEHYAIVERDNHQLAHPDYKFTPNKNGKKRGRQDSDDSDSDSDGEWGGSRATKKSKGSGRKGTRSVSSTPFESRTSCSNLRYSPSPSHPSSYGAINSKTPPPYMFDTSELGSGYYGPQAMPYRSNIDDVRFGPMQPLVSAYEPESVLTGMPEGSEGLLGGLDHASSTAIISESHIDPNLGRPNFHYAYGHYPHLDDGYSIPRSVPYDAYGPPPITFIQDPAHPGMVTFNDIPEHWHQTGTPGLDFDEAFHPY